MKLGSLFDGSGGFPLAGSLCGIEPVWASEVEPYPIAVTRERFPKMKHIGNIINVNGAEIEPVDIITFGSPCQDLSVAGKRAGLKHEANGDEETTRSGLFMEAVRIIKEMREATDGIYPRFALWENVPGAFSSNKGEDFRIVLEEIIGIVEPGAVMPEVPKKGWAYADSYIGDGWSLAYRTFDAQYWGVPQRRRRIHLVADFRGGCAGKILFEREGVRGDLAESGAEREGTAGDAENGAGTADREGTVFGIDHAITTGGNCTAQGSCVYENVQATLKASGVHAVAYNVENITSPLNKVNPIGFEEEITPTPSAGVVPGICIIDTIGGKAERGWQGEVAPTLKKATHYKFPPCVTVPITFEPGIASREGGHIYERVSGTLRANAGDNRMSVAYSIENHPADSRVNIDESGTVQCLTSRMGTGGGNVPLVMEEKEVYCLQGNGIDRADTAGCNGKGWCENKSYTLNTVDRPAVCYREGGYADYVEGTPGTIKASGGALGGGSENIVIEQHPQYIVRRLTHTECARLQGFPDGWGCFPEKEDFTDEEYRFWLDVRKTHAEINGKTVREWTRKQMLTWYNKLHTDSSEYKMWGNGIALPPAVYCMQGIEDALKE